MTTVNIRIVGPSQLWIVEKPEFCTLLFALFHKDAEGGNIKLTHHIYFSKQLERRDLDFCLHGVHKKGKQAGIESTKEILDLYSSHWTVVMMMSWNVILHHSISSKLVPHPYHHSRSQHQKWKLNIDSWTIVLVRPLWWPRKGFAQESGQQRPTLWLKKMKV